MKKYTQIIFVLISVFTILSLIMYPAISPILGTGMLLFSLAIGIHTIFQRHKESENPRLKIGKDASMLVFTIILISFLGGVVGLFVNTYISPIYGLGLGLLCALLVSFGVGYLVKWGMRRLTG